MTILTISRTRVGRLPALTAAPAERGQPSGTSPAVAEELSPKSAIAHLWPLPGIDVQVESAARTRSAR